jgi:hypothetical protein
MTDTADNLPAPPAIFPDTLAPVDQNANAGGRELKMMRWGMPGPPQFGGSPITNIRNAASPYYSIQTCQLKKPPNLSGLYELRPSRVYPVYNTQEMHGATAQPRPCQLWNPMQVVRRPLQQQNHLRYIQDHHSQNRGAMPAPPS